VKNCGIRKRQRIAIQKVCQRKKLKRRKMRHRKKLMKKRKNQQQLPSVEQLACIFMVTDSLRILC
jgi:hypothetical protein